MARRRFRFAPRRPGCVFVAIAGERHDGNDFIGEAIANGATAVYTEREPPPDPPVPFFRVPDARAALAALAARFHGRPADRLHCSGVTGTNGKTTTASLLQWLHNGEGKRAGLLGTILLDSGGAAESTQLTTPDPVVIHAKLAEMVDAGLERAVLEVSSHGLKQRRVDAIPFKTAVFTNLSADHFDFHASYDEYIETKAALFAALSPDGAAVVNADDPVHDAMAAASRAPVYTFGAADAAMGGGRDLEAARVSWRLGQMEIAMRLSPRLQEAHQKAVEAACGPDLACRGELRLRTPLMGRHNLYNVLAAVCAALLEGVPERRLLTAAARFPGMWRRQQRLPVAGPMVIDDCAHNPASYEALFDAIEGLPRRRLYVVNAIRGGRGVEVNRANGRVFARWAARQKDAVIWITDCADSAPETDIVTDAEREAFHQCLERQGVAFSQHPDLEPCLQMLARDLEDGDLALLLGPHAMDRAGDRFVELWRMHREAAEAPGRTERSEPSRKTAAS